MSNEEDDENYINRELLRDVMGRVLKSIDPIWTEVLSGIYGKYVDQKSVVVATLAAYGIVLGYFNESLDRRMRRIPDREFAKLCERLIMDIEKMTSDTIREIGDREPITDLPVGNIKWN